MGTEIPSTEAATALKGLRARLSRIGKPVNSGPGSGWQAGIKPIGPGELPVAAPKAHNSALPDP